MNDLAPRRSGPSVPSLAAPAMSPWLQRAVKDFRNPHPDAGPEPVQPVVRDEAKRIAAALEASLRPATLDEWRAFLLPILAAVANPPDRNAFSARVAAIAEALRDIPAGALSPDAQRDVMRFNRFFPTPADLEPLLRPRCAERMADLSTLRRVAAAPTEREPEQIAPEARAAMAARAHALAAEIRASADAQERGPTGAVRAAPISDGAMLAHLERLAAGGNAIAEHRARMLREKIGAEA
jgi:hypothetical protein